MALSAQSGYQQSTFHQQERSSVVDLYIPTSSAAKPQDTKAPPTSLFHLAAPHVKNPRPAEDVVIKPLDSNIMFDSRIDTIRNKLDQIKKSIQSNTSATPKEEQQFGTKIAPMHQTQ